MAASSSSASGGGGSRRVNVIVRVCSSYKDGGEADVMAVVDGSLDDALDLLPEVVDSHFSNQESIEDRKEEAGADKDPLLSRIMDINREIEWIVEIERMRKNRDRVYDEENGADGSTTWEITEIGVQRPPARNKRRRKD